MPKPKIIERTLPPGFKTWLDLWKKCRELVERDPETEIINWTDRHYPYNIYVFTVDEIKARVFDDFLRDFKNFQEEIRLSGPDESFKDYRRRAFIHSIQHRYFDK